MRYLKLASDDDNQSNVSMYSAACIVCLKDLPHIFIKIKTRKKPPSFIEMVASIEQHVTMMKSR